MKFIPTSYPTSVSTATQNEYMLHDTFRNGIYQIKPEIQNRNTLQKRLESYDLMQQEMKYDLANKTAGRGLEINLKMEKYLLEKVVVVANVLGSGQVTC